MLTIGQRRTVGFKNNILIMTSNIGSQMILGYRGAFDGYEYDRMKEAVLDEVRRFFRPEFLNRVDEINVFHALSEEHLIRIVDIQLERLRTRLAERQIRMDLTEQARRRLVHIGYDPAYGARPLKPAIQKNIDNQFGRLMLEGAIRDGQLVRIDYGRDANRFAFTLQAAPATEPEVVAAR
jgi:ATP-dependent Clp protease ATP-binding subunit ClpB